MSNTKTTKRPRKPAGRSTARAIEKAADAATELSEEIAVATRETEKLQRALIEDQRRRESECAAAVNEVLERYRCRLQPQTVIVGGQINSDVLIVAT